MSMHVEREEAVPGGVETRSSEDLSGKEGKERPAVPPLSSIVVASSSCTADRKGSAISIRRSLGKGRTVLCFRMCDVAVSILLLLPLSIGMWRGIWQIMDFYCEPWLSILLGNSLSFLLYFFQDELKASVHPKHMHFLLFYALSRTLLLVHAMASINVWRGLWVLWDKETRPGDESTSAIASFLIGSGLLILTKAFCNVSATPLFVGVDEAASVHDCLLRYKTRAESKCLYFLDCVWSAVVVQNLVAAAWRGVWNLADIHLYPHDRPLSAFLSLGIGIGIVLLLSILQPCLFRFTMSLEGCMRVAVLDVVTMWGFIGCVLAWRGNWDLYNLFLVFETPLLSEWLTVGVGTVGAIALGCLSTVATRGVLADGEDAGDGSTEWPFSYISLLQREGRDGFPFPEPWLFRYLCTSQSMWAAESRRQGQRSLWDDDEYQMEEESSKVQEGTPHSFSNALMNPSRKTKDEALAFPAGEEENGNKSC